MKYLPYLLLPLGIAIGYLIPRPSPEQPAIVQPAPDPREQRPKPATASPEKAARIKALADSMIKNRTNVGENPAPLSADIADIPAILDQLLSQVGPNGLSYETRLVIDELFQRWAKEDFEGAYHWAKTYPVKSTRANFLAISLRGRAIKDYDGTLALIKSLKNDDGITLGVDREMFDLALKRGAKEAFEVLALGSSGNSNGSSGNSNVHYYIYNIHNDVVFPEGFDFKTFAELAARHSKEAKKDSKQGNSLFDIFPSNLYESWAKTDAAAAYDFFINDHELPSDFNALGKITKNFLNLAEPASSYPWLQQQYESLTGAQREKFAAGLSCVFPSEMGVTPLVSFANSIASPDTRENIVKDMLKVFGAYKAGRDGSYYYTDLLSVLPTPEKRLEVIHQSRMGDSSKSFPDYKLLELGITREQIDAMGKK